MAIPQYQDEVLITLSSLDAPTSLTFPDRRIFLSKEKPTIEIGRTSKRNVSFEAAKSNAWFDSAVMSRKHAVFTLDPQTQKVYVKDSGSLHGTYKNDVRLEKHIDSEVASGDRLKFGAIIDRGSDRYPPCTIRVQFKFGSMNPNDRTKVFRVPDDTDVEDTASEDDQVSNSYGMLRARKIRPATFSSTTPNRPSIDLTGNDQYEVSNVRNDTSPVPYSTGKTISVWSKQHSQDCAAFGPISVPRINSDASKDASVSNDDNVWDVSDAEEEEDINLSQSTDMDTGQSPDDMSEAESEEYSQLPEDGYDSEDADENDYDPVNEDEEDFAEQDEFEQGKPIDFTDYSDDVYLFLEDTVPLNDLVDSTNHSLVTGEALMTATVVGESSAGPFHAICEKPQVDSFQTPVPNPSTHHDDGKNNQIGGVGYLLNHDPALSASTNMMSSVRLPPIFPSMPVNSTHSQDSAMLAAEILGRKTGKYEYFAARAENKTTAFIGTPEPRPGVLEHTQVKMSEQQRVPNLSLNEPEANNATEISNMELEEEVPRVEDDQVEQLNGSGSAFSGTKFLITPLPEVEPEAPSTKDVLDDSSAWELQMRKKASAVETSMCATIHVTDGPEVMDESDNHTGKETELAEDLVQGLGSEERKVEVLATIDSLSDTPRSAKRKAEDISQLTPEEEHAESSSSRLSRKWATSQRRIKDRGAGRCEVMAVVPPPHKRLRRVAEMVGYAALGGVAVMSALIATAPTL
ncbi:hypothetical protein F66182_6767 [Fusarium sp. NRRL 66182]|nr:hypothetical protein F66182_6767 [Fusarium sp. NRRL 66182]